MSYVHSSPWQDAANFGGAIGDRLTEALINLPLKKAQMAQELLANAARLKQGQVTQDFERQRIGLEGKRVNVESKNAETRKEGQFQKGLGDIVREKQRGDMTVETTRHNKAMEQNAGQRIAEQHKQEGEKALETMRHPEFGGRTVKEMVAAMSDDTKQANLAPEEVKAFQDYIAHLKTGAAQEQGQPPIPQRNGLGDAIQVPTTSTGKRFRYDPSSGQLIPQQ